MSASASVVVRQPAAGAAPRADVRARSTLAAAVLGFFVITLDATIVNVALPSIQSGLGGGITGLQWVVDGYTLMFAALLLSAGALSDRVGAKRAFGTGLLIFAAASLICGAAPSLAVLVAARFLQGAGAAVVMPASMALVRHAYADPAGRGRAVAVWAMGGAIAAAAGPVLGGLLSLASWRLIFLVNVPVVAVTVALLARTRPSPHHVVPFDWTGQVLAIAAMGALTFGAIDAGPHGATSPRVLAALAVAVVAGAAFLVVQARAAHPMVPLGLFRSATVNMAVVIGFVFMVGFYGLPFLFSLYFQTERGLSPLMAGVAFLPMMLLSAVVTPFIPRIVERIGPRPPVVAGLVLLAAGAIALAVVPASAPVGLVALLLVPVGLTGPLIMPPTTAVLLESVPGRRTGVASGVFNTSRQVGGALAVAVFGALVSASGGFLHGARISLLVTAVLGLAAAAAGFTLKPRPAVQEEMA